jgi:hypothetical protein
MTTSPKKFNQRIKRASGAGSVQSFPRAPKSDACLASAPPRCTIFGMTKWFFALLLFASTALAQEQQTAYQALRVVGTQLKREFVRHVISVSGENGNPQPATWTILLDDPQARGGVREVEVSNGRVVSERTPLRASVAGSLGATIDTSKLNLDSSGAYTVAQQAAASSHVNFSDVDYTLRVDDRGNPIWTVGLHGANGAPAGKIFIGANHGTITRTEGLFVGTNQLAPNDQETTDQTVQDTDDDDDDGDVNPIKKQIKDTFHKFGHDVKRTFYKVRRSFVDFFQDH